MLSLTPAHTHMQTSENITQEPGYFSRSWPLDLCTCCSSHHPSPGLSSEHSSPSLCLASSYSFFGFQLRNLSLRGGPCPCHHLQAGPDAPLVLLYLWPSAQIAEQCLPVYLSVLTGQWETRGQDLSDGCGRKDGWKERWMMEGKEGWLTSW